jgi:hypothetical protein
MSNQDIRRILDIITEAEQVSSFYSKLSPEAIASLKTIRPASEDDNETLEEGKVTNALAAGALGLVTLFGSIAHAGQEISPQEGRTMAACSAVLSTVSRVIEKADPVRASKYLRYGEMYYNGAMQSGMNEKQIDAIFDPIVIKYGNLQKTDSQAMYSSMAKDIQTCKQRLNF